MEKDGYARCRKKGREKRGMDNGNTHNVSKKGMNKFDFLTKSAVDLRAVNAKVISVRKIAVEDRAVLKCRVGCHTFGKKLMCPPFVPTVDEFRKMQKDYRYALLARFKAEAETDEEVARSLLRCEFDPAMPKELREKAAKFWSDWNRDKKRIHLAVLELEKTAFNCGYTFAVGFTAGSCALCEKCNVEKGICIHSTMARYPEHAVGVNMKKTAEKAGMTITFPFPNKPDPIVLLLID